MYWAKKIKDKRPMAACIKREYSSKKCGFRRVL